MRLAGRRVILGVSGGIASYKACTVARRLTEAGAAVDVVLTAAAAAFVRPVTFEALTGRPVLTSLWDRDFALAHVRFAHDADLILVAPATAHILARAALGLADDLLATMLLARGGPVLAAPAMNDQMYAHPATRANLRTLEQRGWTFVGPEIGPLAEGPSEQPGRMSEPETIVSYAERLLRGTAGPLAGQPVVVTAGPTREALDPVRVITNRSSGRMGYAVAEAAFARGAEVTLISGPTTLPPPPGVQLERVESTADMQGAVKRALRGARVLVMAAAPADFRPAHPDQRKRARTAGATRLELEPTLDILATTRTGRSKNSVMVGFALETGEDLDGAREKLQRKGLHLLVVNRADQPDAGAEVDTNRVVLVTEKEAKPLPLMPKRDVAEHILDAIEALL